MKIVKAAIAIGAAAATLSVPQSATASPNPETRATTPAPAQISVQGNGCGRVYPSTTGGYAPARICVSGTSFVVTGKVYDKKADGRRACASLRYERKSSAGWKTQSLYLACASGNGKSAKIKWDHSSARNPRLAACVTNNSGRKCSGYVKP